MKIYISEICFILAGERITICRYFEVFIMEIEDEISAASDSF